MKLVDTPPSPAFGIRRRQLVLSASLAPLLGACRNGSAATDPWQPLPLLETATMRPDTAYALYLAWQKHVGKVRSHATGMQLQSDSSFIAIHGMADFDYSFADKTLKVMRVLSRGSVTPAEESDPGIVATRRLGQLEPYTLGGGQFYINPHPWISDMERVNSPDMNTNNLMRAFNDDRMTPARFVTDVRWLVFWGEYWNPRVAPLEGLTESGLDRAFRTPEEQAATRPELEKWARKILSKPNPPDARTPF